MKIELSDKERIEDLQCESLKIIQNKELYTFTSDSVVLANFVKIKKKEVAVEVGSGSGVISILLSIVGITFLIPIVVAIYCGETAMLMPFLIPMIVSIIAMLVINIPTRKIKFNLSTKKTFITVALSWLFASLFGALPFYRKEHSIQSLFHAYARWGISYTCPSTVCALAYRNRDNTLYLRFLQQNCCISHSVFLPCSLYILSNNHKQ